ncbi:histidine kinase [Kaistella sp. G5-32]|uniref:histidine kinase n=1 Tax=Kaistella gelatinilytica TaxID=2787636 RepID=A0ABS0F977_9FLAO|nr:ATP-binding protein [Kaistella gelatinilytica]MBF8456264.1 histidine kinase [Kaistella gelatinilytica]
MNLEFTILIIILVFLRKILQSKILLPKTDKFLLVGIWSAIILLIANIIFQQINTVFIWIANLMLITLIYFCLTNNDFKPVKSFIYSILPFAIVNVISDLTKLIWPKFHTQWESYFDTAILFSIIWFLAMYFINKKQRKAIEQAQRKAIEREKEFQESEILKAKLEIQVAERTAELLGQKNELQKALDELKITQNQLIQSEKMASLGELTAGIAHEIQNPLNFVNNFSEVNKELIDELQAELKSGNVSEAITISNDIKQNEEKINHHGKRADGIVKGMLQHSRSSTGVKEPTDLNALCDEYLRLSYHGLRAKDKTFNATIRSDFDDSIGQINLIPQDFGRVILNLLTNAFYAVNEKKKLGSEGYQPTVSISTQKVQDEIIITITDNGSGMSNEVKEKIFQPFFTTKPTGEGTGLGLSMSYDIITKGHNAELKVESEVNEGTKFQIILKNTH